MVGLLEYLENLSPGQVQALASAGSALSALGGSYVDPTERGRGFRQALLEAPERIQAAEQGALQQQLGRQQVQAQEAALAQQQQQQTAQQGLRDFILGRAAQPGGAAAQAATPATAPDAFAGAPAGGQPQQPGLQQLLAAAYPELFAQQLLGQMFQQPREQKLYTLGEGERLFDPTGQVVAEGAPKVEKPTTLVRNLKAAGIDPMSPEGRDLIRDNLTRAATEVNIKEGEKKGAFFATRMRAASDRIRQLEGTGYDPTTFTELFRAMGGNWTRSKEGQQYRAAAREWMAPVLRYESGAAIPEQEFETYYETYFPVPGDNEETIRQKAAARASLESGMLGAYGGVAQQLGMQPQGAQAPQAPQTPRAPTAPATANEYKQKYPFLK